MTFFFVRLALEISMTLINSVLLSKRRHGLIVMGGIFRLQLCTKEVTEEMS
jgi:hypothetical protein